MLWTIAGIGLHKFCNSRTAPPRLEAAPLALLEPSSFGTSDEGSNKALVVGVLSWHWNYRGHLESLQKLLCLPQRETTEPRTPVRVTRRLTPDEVSQLVGDRQSGAEINELADRYGVHRDTVINHLRRAGVEGRRHAGRSLSPTQIRAAGELYRSGVSLIEVGERFDVDRRYLRRVLPEAGVVLRRGRQKVSAD